MTTATKTERRRALEAPHRAEHERSLDRRFTKGAMPKGLGGLLKWYSDIWDAEVPTSIHKSEVWHGWDARVRVS